ncbi:MAG: helix-turn-helix domain-containing protein, partial [bacterium]|nr:helix-turn-helix domain-containing protein [bacterium]
MAGRLLKIGEAAKILKISQDTLRRWEKTGKITAIRTPGGTRLYSLESLKTFLPQDSTSAFKPLKKLGLGVSLRTLRRWKAKGQTLVITPLPLPTSPSPVSNQEKVERTIREAQLKSLENPQEIYLAEPDLSSSYNLSFRSSLFKITSIVLVSLLISTTLLTGVLTAFYLTNPVKTKAFFASKSSVSSFLSPFNQLSLKILPALSPQIASSVLVQTPVHNSISSSVLAEEAVGRYLEINSDTYIKGDLIVERNINGVNLESLEGGGIRISDLEGTTSLDISGSNLTLDQELAGGGTPTIEGLNLTSTKNQLVLGPVGGITGTLSWTPASSSKTLTLPDITDTLISKTST